MTMNMTIPSRLSDSELVAEVTRLAAGERQATASLIAHLAELYGRRLHERAGFASLFTYCTDVLRLSEHEAYDRMKAAKVVRRYPGVLGLLESGQVNLTTVRLLVPHLTRQNHEELFAEASGKRKRQVQELLARRFPKPDVASSVRKLPRPKVVQGPVSVLVPAPVPVSIGASPTTGSPPATPLAGGPEPAMVGGDSGVTSPERVPARPYVPPPTRPLVRPLALDRYQVTFTAGADVCEKLQLAQDLLRHAIPSGDPAQIFARSLDVLIQELVKQKYALTSRPQASRGEAEDSRYIPAEVKRTVYIRDHGCCAFVGTGGRRCGERSFVEFHHGVPYAAGGRPTVENIELRCRAHNGYEAEMFYGPMKRYADGDGVREEAARYESNVSGMTRFVPERNSAAIAGRVRRLA